MAITFISNTAGTNGSGANMGVINFPASGISAGDFILLSVAVKHTAASMTTPTGFTFVGSVAGGSGTDGGDSGTVRTIMYYKIADGTENGTTITPTLTSSSGHQFGITVWSNATGAWTIEGPVTESTDTTTTANLDITGNFGSAVASAGDLVIYQVALNSDTHSLGTMARSFPGDITSLHVERQDRSGSTGNDTRLVVKELPITGGSGSGNFSTTTPYAGTIVTNVAPFAATIGIILKEATAAVALKQLGLLGVG